MDPLTHGLAGAALGMLVARENRLGGAALAGALAALAPDLDVLVASDTDPLLQLEVHRQFTHSLFVAPFIGVLVAGLLFALMTVFGRREPAWRPWLAPACLGALSAGLLDACTSYGTALLWPFTDQRIAFNVVAVVDPVVTIVLLAGTVAALWRASASSAWIGVMVALVYLSSGAVQHDRAAFAARNLAAERGHVIETLLVKPTLGNQLVWRSVYRAGGRFHVDGVRVGWFSRAVVYPGASIAELDVDRLGSLDGHARRDIDRFDALSSNYLVRHPRHGSVVGDIRYAMSPDSIEPLWGIEPGTPNGTVWHNFRQLSDRAGRRFRSMLFGEPLDRLPPISAGPDASEPRPVNEPASNEPASNEKES